jgi:predicted nicotinamide N-methyase
MHGYRTRQDSIAVDGVDDLIIRSLVDRQQFDDPDAAAAALGISSATWPLFGLLWPSGRQLAACMARHPVTAGERVLEVGCGLALASLVAHRRGADVTASDHHPLAEGFLLENLRLNDLPPMKFRLGPWGLPPGAPPSPGAGYELLVGSDVLYDRDASLDLAGFIGHHASAAAAAWVVDPDRGNRSGFNRRMAELGFHRTEQRLDRASDAGADGYRGRLMTYRRG